MPIIMKVSTDFDPQNLAYEGGIGGIQVTPGPNGTPSHDFVGGPEEFNLAELPENYRYLDIVIRSNHEDVESRVSIELAPEYTLELSSNFNDKDYYMIHRGSDKWRIEIPDSMNPAAMQETNVTVGDDGPGGTD